VPVLNPLELYLPDDPAQTKSSHADQPQLVVELGADLQAHASAGASAPVKPVRAQLDDETRARLRALGYDE
jgi:hypothetical protein